MVIVATRASFGRISVKMTNGSSKQLNTAYAIDRGPRDLNNAVVGEGGGRSTPFGRKFPETNPSLAAEFDITHQRAESHSRLKFRSPPTLPYPVFGGELDRRHTYGNEAPSRFRYILHFRYLKTILSRRDAFCPLPVPRPSFLSSAIFEMMKTMTQTTIKNPWISPAIGKGTRRRRGTSHLLIRRDGNHRGSPTPPWSVPARPGAFSSHREKEINFRNITEYFYSRRHPFRMENRILIFGAS